MLKKTEIWKENINKNIIQLKEKNVDWFYSKERTFKDHIVQETIFDGLWLLLWKEKDSLLYNKEALWLTEEEWGNRWKNILENTRENIADILIWVDFKKPERNIVITKWQYLEWKGKWLYDVWYTDNLLVEDPFKNSEFESIALWGAVWDCAWITSFYKWNEKEIIWITHAWYTWLKNKVVEQLIDAYKTFAWRENIKNVFFDVSPTAWINYEFEKDYLLKIFKDTFKEYDIDYIQDEIFIPYKDNKERWYFMIWKLLKRILLENWIEEEQLNIHQDYTTSVENNWPSYRLHTLSTKWLFNWKIIPNARLWVFNILRKWL